MPTFMQVARHIAEAHGWDDQSRQSAQRTIRHLASRGLIVTHETQDGRGTLEIEEGDIFRVRLYLALVEAGLQLGNLERIGNVLDEWVSPTPSGVIEDGEGNIRPIPTGPTIDAVVRAIEDGETWFFHVVIVREKSGSRGMWGGFFKGEDTYPGSDGFATEAIISIPVSTLFAPLLRK